MVIGTEITLKRIATYERVSSEDQRQRGTIQTQSDELARRLDQEPGIHLVERYRDDGFSGRYPWRNDPPERGSCRTRLNIDLTNFGYIKSTAWAEMK